MDVREEALLQLGMRLAQAEIDRALAFAKLAKVQEIVGAALAASTWIEGPTEDGVTLQAPRTAMLPAEMVLALQSVVTSP